MKSTTSIKLLLLTFFLTTQVSFSQVKIGGKVGYSIGRITDNSDNIYTEEYESSSGVDVGVFIEYPVSELFSLQMEILYTQRGGERNGMQPKQLAQINNYSLYRNCFLSFLIYKKTFLSKIAKLILGPNRLKSPGT